MPQLVTDIISTDKAVANSEKRLSICLRSNGFSFSVVSTDDTLLTFGVVQSQQPLSASQLAQQVIQTLGEHDAVLDYKKMRLVIPSMHFVWIPAHLYDPSHNRQYLATVAPVDHEANICRSYSKSLDSYIVFTAPADIVTAFKIAIPGVDIICQHAVLAEALPVSTYKNHPAILLHLRDNVADIEAFYNGRLLLSASYPAQNNDELLYHAINVMKQLHLETPDMELAICGMVDRDIYSHLQHFFPNVTLFTGKPFTYLNPDFQTLHTYKHTLVLS